MRILPSRVPHRLRAELRQSAGQREGRLRVPGMHLGDGGRVHDQYRQEVAPHHRQ